MCRLRLSEAKNTEKDSESGTARNGNTGAKQSIAPMKDVRAEEVGGGSQGLPLNDDKVKADNAPWISSDHFSP